MGDDERFGNFDDNIEWESATNTWVRRQSLTLPRGHASASTIPVNCGFLVAGGSTNELWRIRCVSFRSCGLCVEILLMHCFTTFVVM